MPRQERAHATRRTILVAAAEEFERVGYFGTSIGAILARAGVTKGSFYFHFTSKDALVQELVHYQAEIAERVAAEWVAREVDPLRTLVGMVQEMAERTASDTVLAAAVRLSAERGLLLRGAATEYPMWERACTKMLGQAREAGHLRDGVDVATAARLLNQLVVGARALALTQGARNDYPDRVREIWTWVLPLITTPEWHAGWVVERRAPAV